MKPRVWIFLVLGLLLTGLRGSASAGPGETLREIRCAIHPDLPVARFELKGSRDGSVSVIREIEFYWGDENDPVQVISTGGARTPDARDAGFILEDMNFDGYTDFRVQAFIPAGPNIPYLYWLYDSGTGAFAGNRDLEEIASPTFHPEEGVIRSVNRSSAAVQVSRAYRYVDGTPALFRVEETRIDPEEGVREITVQERREGEWVVTDERRVSLWSPFPLPPSITVRQRIEGSPRDWEVLAGGKGHRITRITVYDGRPERQASLRYDDEDIRGDRRVTVWKLGTPVSAEGYWITVHYASTNITLAKRLPDGISALRVITVRNRRVQGFEAIERVEVR